MSHYPFITPINLQEMQIEIAQRHYFSSIRLANVASNTIVTPSIGPCAEKKEASGHASVTFPKETPLEV